MRCESQAKLSNEQAAIVKFDVYRLPGDAYGKMFGVSGTTIRNIMSGKTYKHITREHLPPSLIAKPVEKQIVRDSKGRYSTVYREIDE
jgi:hypothetical protein